MSAHFRKRLFLILMVCSITPLALLPVQALASEESTFHCGPYTTSPSFFGTGMVQGIEQFSITEPSIVFHSATENCAVVTWIASAPTASAVVYDTQENAPSIPQLDTISYGFTYKTPQDNRGNNVHIAILNNLDPNTTYVFRTVTRSHPTALPHISDARTVRINTSSPAPSTPILTTLRTNEHTTTAAKTSAQKYSLSTSVPTVHTSIMPRTEAKDAKVAPAYERALTEIPAPSPTIPLINIDHDFEFVGTTSIPIALTAAEEAHKTLSKRDGFVVLGGSTSLMHTVKVILIIICIGVVAYLLYSILAPHHFSARVRPVFGALLITALISISAIALMWYYLALVGVALFLGLLAWYLVQSAPEIDVQENSVQPKLLDAPHHDAGEKR